MFKLEFDTDNAAFDHRAASETARILREVGEKIKNGYFNGKVMDVNGNSIGTFELNGD